MTVIKNCPEISVFRKLPAVGGVDSGTVPETFWFDGRHTVDRHQAARRVEITVVERLGQREAVCLIDVTKSGIQIRGLARPRADIFVHIVIKAQGVNQNGLSNIMRQRG